MRVRESIAAKGRPRSLKFSDGLLAYQIMHTHDGAGTYIRKSNKPSNRPVTKANTGSWLNLFTVPHDTANFPQDLVLMHRRIWHLHSIAARQHLRVSLNVFRDNPVCKQASLTAEQNDVAL